MAEQVEEELGHLSISNTSVIALTVVKPKPKLLIYTLQVVAVIQLL